MSKVGETAFNNFGSKMIIEEYISSNEVRVKFFENGNFVKARYDNFVRGKVKNPYDKTAHGVGFIGEGKYPVTEKGKTTKAYTKWRGMLRRCYDEKEHIARPTYIGCSVSEEWHNFQNFAKWFDENYYEIGGERMELDKDILIKGNKVYSPETCVFVPSRINILFVKSNSIRGSLPIGVSWNKYHKKYEAYYHNNGKRIKLGYFKLPEEAFLTYKLHKEELIKQIAEQYKGKIPLKLYETLVNYQVEIDD